MNNKIKWSEKEYKSQRQLPYHNAYLYKVAVASDTTVEEIRQFIKDLHGRGATYEFMGLDWYSGNAFIFVEETISIGD